MPVKTVFEQSALQLVVSLFPTASSQEEALDQTVDQLFEALQVIRGQLMNKDIYHFAIDICGSHEGGDEFDPWSDEAIPAWSQIAVHSRLHGRLEQWLSEVEKLIAEANSGVRSNGSVWELDEYQLGEVAACAFALVSRNFVPFYVRLLKVWDLDHMSHLPEAIEAIVKRHSICPEIEELLFELETSGYGHGQAEALFPYLQEQYGDFPNSPLFRRMVETLHAKDLAWRISAHENYLERLAKDSNAKPTNLSKRHIFAYCPSAPALTEAANRLLAELDLSAGPLPSA
jgi:hypothetical protein